MKKFKNPALEQLTDQQVRYAPPARRQEQLARAEKLLKETDPEKQYPYQYVCYRITDYRPDAFPDLLIDGEDLTHDLRLMIESLTLPAEAVSEPFVTLEEVSKQLNVSTKTVRRWRECGLVGRRILRNGKLQLGFPMSVVEQFKAKHADRVKRGSRFTQLSDDEKEAILRRAKRLSGAGCATLSEISRRIGRRLGRSPETVRYTIKNYDKDHPGHELFPEVVGPLPEETKEVIFNLYRRGMSVKALGCRFRRKRRTIYLIIQEIKARRLVEQSIDPIYHESFEDKAAEAEILAPMPNLESFEEQRSKMKAPKDVPAELAPLFESPLLNKEQEQHLFRKMNFLKFKGRQLRDGIDPKNARVNELDQLREFHKQIEAVKEVLIKSNMRLVVSIAKRHVGTTGNIFELLSDGNMSLIRAVDKFDFSRGNKFSTYASWAIMKNFARTVPDEKTHRERYVTGQEEMFDATADRRSNEHEQLTAQAQAANRVNHLLDALEPRLQQIVRMRAGLDNSEGMTLEEIGQQMGLTKERVRQLSVRAMNQLRVLARDQKIEMP